MQKTWKKSKKILKRVLTRRKDCSIIGKPTCERDEIFLGGAWSLKIEQHEISTNCAFSLMKETHWETQKSKLKLRLKLALEKVLSLRTEYTIF